MLISILVATFFISVVEGGVYIAVTFHSKLCLIYFPSG